MNALYNIKTHSVFYARITHMYFPFIVWGAVVVSKNIRDNNIRKFVLITALILSFVSFGEFYLRYLKTDYPRDILYKYHIFTYNLSDDKFIYESNPLRKIDSPVAWNMVNNYPYNKENNYTLVNFEYFYDFVSEYKKFIPGGNMKLIYSAPHFLSLPAYQFEGFSPSERKALSDRKYEMKIYRGL